MPGQAVRNDIIARAQQIVVKVGTNSLCEETGRPNRRAFSSLARQIARVRKGGVNVVLVASGAIGAGMGELGLAKRPRSMPRVQATAAVGQGQMMRLFHDVFRRHDIPVAQVLLTRDDFNDRTRYLNIRNTLTALTEYGALPIINENDTVAVDEIRFGENDILAASVTNMLSADVLILLTTVDGVLKEGEVLDVIETVDEEAMGLAEDRRSSLGSGGMASKLQAAGMVIRAGEAVVIANARTPNVLTKLLAGRRIGTVFVPAERRISGRRRWIGQAARTQGRVVIDDGAVRALTQRGKSLLPSGIRSVEGNFPKGAAVTVVTLRGREIARGLTNYSSSQLEEIRGCRSTQIAGILGDKPYDEAIHRNNLMLKD